MVRFQRQPPGTAITRGCLLVGGALSAVAGGLVIGRSPQWAVAAATGGSAGFLLVGGHRANHGAGGPVDRMLDDLLDRAWDAAVFGSIAWVARETNRAVAAAALIALCASYLSSYVRARGAALAYSVEESHVTRGVRYALVTGGLALGWLGWTLWAAAGTAALAAIVRTGQVAGEERIA